MKNDQEYFSEYFTLCEFFLQKRGILEKTWKAVRENTCDSEHWRKLKELKEFDASLKEEDDIFWRDVCKGESEGARFRFEEFAREHGLGFFEKKTLLFLLFALLHYPASEWQISELVVLLDPESSWNSRLKFYTALSPESPLFKKNILVFKPRASGDLSDGIVLFNPSSRAALTRFDFGTPEPIPAFVKKEGEVENETGVLRDPEYGMDDVILSQKIKDDVLFHIDTWKGGLAELGIEEKIKKGRGSIFLFYGPPGTGKSMLADAVARRLGKKILQVSLPQITDKMFGETEKHITNLFKTAKTKDAVICFDEAESLLYSRQHMQQERDNAFVHVLFEEIERFDGVMCLTTNLDTSLDAALERRVSLKVRFTPPDEMMRPGIWRSHIPTKVTIASDVDFEALGRKYVMSGGYIKNAVMNALRRLAQDKRTIITMDDLLFGAQMERDGMFLKENKGPIGFAGLR